MLVIRYPTWGRGHLRQLPLRSVFVTAMALIWGSNCPSLASKPPVDGSTKPCALTSQTELFSPPCDRAANPQTTPLPAMMGARTFPPEPVEVDFDGAMGGPEADDPLIIANTPAPFSAAHTVEIDPAIIESSPVLQRWLEEVPDVSVDIQHDPAFRPRLRVGYAQHPSTDNHGGFYIGVQDVFIGRTPLALSAEYSTDGPGDRELIGADASYYLLPLGWYGNVAPVLGYRSINNSTFDSDGINVGLRIILVPSRTGAVDLALTQSWVSPGTEEEVGLTTFSAGYAIADDIRLGTDIQTQNTRDRQESRISLLLEWML
jgi:hypothetical protein